MIKIIEEVSGLDYFGIAAMLVLLAAIAIGAVWVLL